MPDGLLRIEAKATWEGTANLVRHILGELRPPTARDVPEPIEGYGGDSAAALAALREAQADRKRRKVRGARPCELVDVLFAGPPSYGTPEEWTRELETEWAQACMSWLRDVLGPRAPIVAAAVHRDETSPHLHVLAVPIGADGDLGWTRIERAAVERAGGSMKRRGGGYTGLQDAFYADVSRFFGLGRGERGSKRKRAPTDRRIAAEHARRLAEDGKAAAELDRAAAVRDAAKLRDGDDALGSSHGVTWGKKARAGKREREARERELRKAREGEERARAEATAAKQGEAMARERADLLKRQRDEAKRERDEAKRQAEVAQAAARAATADADARVHHAADFVKAHVPREAFEAYRGDVQAGRARGRTGPGLGD